MNAVELALEKQRLRIDCALQRQTLGLHVAGMGPLFAAADRVQAGARWLKAHPEAAVGGVAALLALRPRGWGFLWRWGRRGFLGWKLWRESDRWLARFPLRPPAAARGAESDGGRA